jgi:hypothetical protein
VGPSVAGGYLGDVERSGVPPEMPWPAYKAELATAGNKAETAIIWRGHELRERHPGATVGELGNMLAGDDVWTQNAKLIPPARRTFVIREALMPW